MEEQTTLWLNKKHQRRVLGEIEVERDRQDSKWGGAESDDTRKNELDWIEDIQAYVSWAKQMHRMGSPQKYRRRMMQIASLACAACESFDRQRDIV